MHARPGRSKLLCLNQNKHILIWHPVLLGPSKPWALLESAEVRCGHGVIYRWYSSLSAYLGSAAVVLFDVCVLHGRLWSVKIECWLPSLRRSRLWPSPAFARTITDPWYNHAHPLN